jgi:hypothetical protein
MSNIKSPYTERLNLFGKRKKTSGRNKILLPTTKDLKRLQKRRKKSDNRKWTY